MIGFAAPGERDLDRELCEIGGRGPETIRGQLRKEAPLSRERLAVPARTRGSAQGKRRRKFPLEGAVCHPCRQKNAPAHEVFKGFARDVFHQQTGDSVAAAGVVTRRAWGGGDANRRIICGRKSIQRLGGRGHRLALGIAVKSTHIQSGGVTQEAAQRDFPGGRELVIGHLPGFEFQVHVFIERELRALDQPHGAGSRNGLADRGRLEERARGDRSTASGCCDAKASRPAQSIVINNGDAETRVFVDRHQLSQRHFERSLAGRERKGQGNAGRFRNVGSFREQRGDADCAKQERRKADTKHEVCKPRW